MTPKAGALLLSMIHERTLLKPLPPITAENYPIWVQAWFETAEEMANEFEHEGLMQTAKALREEIKWQRERCS